MPTLFLLNSTRTLVNSNFRNPKLQMALLTAFAIGLAELSFFAQAVGAPDPTPTRYELDPQSEKWLKSVRQGCSEYFPGKIQVGINRACSVGAQLFQNSSRSEITQAVPAVKMAQAGCRLQYGEESSETAACLIGTLTGHETAVFGNRDPKHSVTAKAFQACSAVYLVRTELDTYLLESCLTGALAPEFVSSSDRTRDPCLAVSPEKSFLGPCRVGTTLLTQNGSEATSADAWIEAAEHRVRCEKYFDHLRFHMGYRNCIVGRAVAMELSSQRPSVEALKSACDKTVADSGNDHERGACMVGATLAIRTLDAPFDRCGVAQVSYQDRDFLGCLAAASFLSLSNRNQADLACRSIFRDKRSLVRSSCTASLTKLSTPKAELAPAEQL